MCVVSGLVVESFLQAHCSIAITISFSLPSFSCLWRVFLQLPRSAARVNSLFKFPIIMVNETVGTKAKETFQIPFHVPEMWQHEGESREFLYSVH